MKLFLQLLGVARLRAGPLAQWRPCLSETETPCPTSKGWLLYPVGSLPPRPPPSGAGQTHAWFTWGCLPSGLLPIQAAPWGLGFVRLWILGLYNVSPGVECTGFLPAFPWVPQAWALAMAVLVVNCSVTPLWHALEEVVSIVACICLALYGI